MASSAAIMAQIKAKEAEKESLGKYYRNVEKVSDELKCLQSAMGEAGSAMQSVGTIGGKFLDGGKTLEAANNLGEVYSNIGDTLKTISSQCAELESEIADLYAAYNAALREEWLEFLDRGGLSNE